jgi:integrase
LCGNARSEHIIAKVDHEYHRDERLPGWRGWHAFRRGLATNLHDLRVDDKTIQSILRHSNIAVTQKCYIKSLPKQSQATMELLESALCAERAPKTDSEPSAKPVN